MKRIFLNLALIVVSLALPLLAGEGLVRLFYDRLATYNMEMWRYASDLKEPRRDARLPFVHFPNRGGQYYGAEITTDSLGFRDRDVARLKPAGTRRAVMLGDSFTLGWGVPFAETYAKRLETLLSQGGPPWEVVNTGVGNYNTVMELELFKLKGLALDPDLVILMYYINDAEPTPQVASPLKVALLKNSYLVALLSDRFIKFKAQFDRHYDWRAYYAGLYQDNPPALDASRRALTELIALCAARKIPLLIVNIPELRQLRPYPFPMATAFVGSIAQNAHVPFLDLMDDLAAEDPATLWVTKEDPHANGKANGIMAQSMFRTLRAHPELMAARAP